MEKVCEYRIYFPQNAAIFIKMQRTRNTILFYYVERISTIRARYITTFNEIQWE